MPEIAGRGDFKYPESIDDLDGIKLYADDIVGAHKYFRHEMERVALRNILYYLGVQWIGYEPQLRYWRPLGLKKNTPRPVTNRFASLVNSLVSTLVGYQVPISFGPAAFSDDDIAAANVADKIDEIIGKEARIRYLKPLVARWVALTGNVFLINQYDTSPDSGTTFIPSEQCPECGGVFQPLETQASMGGCPTCPPDEMGVPVGPLQPAIGGDGQPIGVEYPKGRFYTEVKPLFSCYFDPEAPFINESPYFLVSETKGREWVERTYGKELADKAGLGTTGDPYTSYMETIAYSTAVGGRMWGYSPTNKMDRIRVRRMWLRPRQDKASKGIYAVLVGDEVAEVKEWSYHNEKGEGFLNVVHIGFDAIPGRLLYKTRCDDIAPKQEQRNRIEAIIELHSIRMANSVWLIPDGVGVSRVTGEQGQIIRYNAMAGTPPPSRIPGDPVNPYLMQWLGQIDIEMDTIFGMPEVARGEAPRGVRAYAAIQYLDERAQAGLSNVLDNWALGWMEWSQQMLNIWREYADEERMTSVGEGAWAMQKFTAADLTGGVDVTVQLGQNKPRTQVGRRAIADQAIRLALANPYDPGERMRLLELIGLPELMEDYKIDQQRAAKENDAFAAGVPAPDPVPWDNHDIHVMSHRRFMLSDTYELLPPEIQVLVQNHVSMHWEALNASAMMRKGPGTIAPGGGGDSEGGGGGDGEGEGDVSDSDQIGREAQNASPETNTGAPGPGE